MSTRVYAPVVYRPRSKRRPGRTDGRTNGACNFRLPYKWKNNEKHGPLEKQLSWMTQDDHPHPSSYPNSW